MFTEETKFGPMTLFFGARSRAMDLYAGEKQDMMEAEVLTKCHLALSREPGVPKVGGVGVTVNCAVVAVENTV